MSLWPLGTCGLGWRVCALVVNIEAAVYVSDTYVHIEPISAGVLSILRLIMLCFAC